MSFNKIFKTMEKEKEKKVEDLKKEIAGYADEILDFFQTRDMNLGMMTDVLQTVNNYLRTMQLRQTIKDLRKGDLPDSGQYIIQDDPKSKL